MAETSEGRVRESGQISSSVPLQPIAGLAAAIGFWIFWSPILFTGFGTATLLVVLGGVVVTAVAIAHAVLVDAGRDTTVLTALAVVVALVGAGVAAVPLLANLHGSTLEGSVLVSGALVALLGLVLAYGSATAKPTTA